MATKDLKEPQHKSLQSLATVIEEKLQEIEALLCLCSMPIDNNRQLKIENDLTTQEKNIFVNKLAVIRKNTLEFAKAYGLTSTESSLKKTLTVKAAFLWEEISGVTFDRLKGYGEIDEGMRQEYESYANSLTDLASDLMHISSNQDNN
ncbi:hypothetical protein [Albibacterium bauzanense]|uniref:Uncharacterized protein n=1 Tax=Albibacterium bauzanense TaxID=653929 RepID=A0A4R1LW22_9SPHI|nr:hypothetical protein [Albibacterium bauzanense]TCK83646.1 hypothetical protein C8N28_2251 [Albibacterium bauzanense]